MNIDKVLIGTDPELFLKKDNEVVSAEGIIGGTKNEPKYITDEGHAVQEDNVMVEFNIPASSTAKEFKDNINTVLSYLTASVALNGMELHFSASEKLDAKYLQTEQAKMFGCEPDYNVYERCVNEAPKASSKLRTCGGHIHIGYLEPNMETTEIIIKAMDLFLGVPSIIMDEDERRKTMYGKAGAFRFKDYGTEYRTLSNFWIYTDELKEWAFNSTINALKYIQNEDNLKNLLSLSESVVNCINNNNKDLAMQIIDSIEEIKIINNKIEELI